MSTCIFAREIKSDTAHRKYRNGEHIALRDCNWQNLGSQKLSVKCPGSLTNKLYYEEWKGREKELLD